MKTNSLKIYVIIFFAIPALFLTFLRETPAVSGSPVIEEPAAVYKAKCAMCHGQKAEKSFDPTKTEEHHVEAILKGVKGAKPPFMPGYEAKGMTAEEALGLTKYMIGLRPAN